MTAQPEKPVKTTEVSDRFLWNVRNLLDDYPQDDPTLSGTELGRDLQTIGNNLPELRFGHAQDELLEVYRKHTGEDLNLHLQADPLGNVMSLACKLLCDHARQQMERSQAPVVTFTDVVDCQQPGSSCDHSEVVIVDD